jgi:hypothetical protein
MSTSPGTWRRPSRWSRALVALLAPVCFGATSAVGAPADGGAQLTFTRLIGDTATVWVANADGSHPRRLAHGTDGRLSANGRWLAYDFLPRESSGEYLVSVSGGRQTRLGRGVFAWSPRGARLAFAGKTALDLVEPALHLRRTLVRARDISDVSFAPDGRALVIVRSTVHGTYADLRSDIFTVRLSDGRIRRLTHDGRSGAPAWGGGWIAYRHYRRTKWPQIGGVWLMRPDGSEQHLFARGDQSAGSAHYGLDPVELSRDGTRLLACTAAEFGCSPVAFFLGTTKRHRFVVGEFPRHVHAIMAPTDLSPDGRRVLVWVGSVDGAAPDDMYAVPFAGGSPRLVAHNADDAAWRG